MAGLTGGRSRGFRDAPIAHVLVLRPRILCDDGPILIPL